MTQCWKDQSSISYEIINFILKLKSGMAMYTYNPNAWDAEAGGLYQV